MRLNRDEIRLLAGIVLALAIGVAVKNYRTAHPTLKAPAPASAQSHDPDGARR